MATSTPRAMGPSLSSDQQRGMAPVRGPRPCDAAAQGGADDPAFGLAADGKGHQAGRDGGPGTGAGTGCAFFGQPRVHGLATEPDVVERQRPHAQFGDQYGARLV